MQIHTQIVSDFQQNARIIKDPETQLACIIDPGADVDSLLDIATSDNYSVESIFLTHCHIDHGGGVKALLDLMKEKNQDIPPLYYHSDGQLLADNIESYGALYGFTAANYQNVPKANVDCKDLETFSVGALKAKVLFTPGHAPGHVVLYFEKRDCEMFGDYRQPINQNPILIAGDTLFRGSIGRTDLPGGNHELLIKNIKEKLLILPKDTVVLSGHGPNTTIGLEKVGNGFLL